jgi:iron complex transport system ATP-binding protein
MIKATNLVKKYGNRKVLSGVHTQIREGEILGILGPNGSGKSTLIRLLSGLEQPDQGEIWLDEVPLSRFSIKERAKRIAVVPQEGAETLSISVEEYVLMGREPYQRWWPWYQANDWMIADRWIRQLDVHPFRNQPLYCLSGGERQRAEIAKVMVQEPKYVFLDEPTNHLDLKYQVSTLSMLKRLKQEKQMAIMIVMHDLNLAAQYCDHLLFLKDGQRIGYGKPAQIIDQELIQEVYGIDALVIQHPKTSIPQVLYQSRKE